MNPLRAWRKRKGLTLEAAAAMVGTTRQTWYGWESGRRRPSAHYMPLIRNITGGEVPADAFYRPMAKAA